MLYEVITFLDGQNVTRISSRRIPYIRRKIGFIFQDHHLLFDRTVFDNVALPLIIAGYRRITSYNVCYTKLLRVAN